MQELPEVTLDPQGGIEPGFLGDLVDPLIQALPVLGPLNCGR